MHVCRDPLEEQCGEVKAEPDEDETGRDLHECRKRKCGRAAVAADWLAIRARRQSAQISLIIVLDDAFATEHLMARRTAGHGRASDMAQARLGREGHGKKTLNQPAAGPAASGSETTPPAAAGDPAGAPAACAWASIGVTTASTSRPTRSRRTGRIRWMRVAVWT